MSWSRRRALAGLGALPLVGCSQLGNERNPPRLPRTTRVSLPTVDHGTLAHGSELRLVEDHGVPLVAMAVAVRAGYRNEPGGQEGLARLATSSLLEGVEGDERLALLGRYGDLGTTPHASLEPSLLGLRCTVHADDAPAALSLLVSDLRRPTLVDAAFERLRREQREVVMNWRGEPTDVAGLGVLLGSTGLEPPTAVLASGTFQSIAALRAEAVRAWLAAHVRPDALVVMIAGAARRDEALAWIDSATRGWTATGNRPSTPAASTVSATGSRIVLVPWSSLPQTIIALGGPRSPYGHADEPAETVAISMLGSLLHHELREQQRTTYAVVPATWDTKLGPVFRLEAKVEPTDVERALGGVLERVGQLVYDQDTIERVLEGMRRFITMGLMDDHHGPDAALGQLWRVAAEGLPSDAATERLARLEALEPKDVQAAAKRLYEPRTVRLGIVGDLAALEAARKVLPREGVVKRRPEELVGSEVGAAAVEPV